MPNAWESAPLVDDKPAAPAATPAWQSAPVVSAAPSAPASPPAPQAWQSAPVVDTPAPSPAAPPSIDFGGGTLSPDAQRVALGQPAPTYRERLSQGVDDAAENVKSIGRDLAQVPAVVAGNVDRYVGTAQQSAATHPEGYIRTGNALASDMGDNPFAPDPAATLPAVSANEIIAARQFRDEGAARQAEASAAIKNPVVRFGANAVVPMGAAIIGGLGAGPAGAGVAGGAAATADIVDTVDRRLREKNPTANPNQTFQTAENYGAALAVPNVAVNAFTGVGGNVVKKIGADMLVGAGTNALTQAATTNATGDDFSVRELIESTLGAGAISAISRGGHAALEAVARGLKQVREARPAWADAPVTGGGEVSSPPPAEAPKTRVDPIGATKNGGGENVPPPPGTLAAEAVTKEAPSEGTRNTVEAGDVARGVDERATGTPVAPSVESVVGREGASAQPVSGDVGSGNAPEAGRDSGGGVAEPVAREPLPPEQPRPDPVKPVADANDAPQDQARQNLTGDSLPATPHVESVPPERAVENRAKSDTQPAPLAKPAGAEVPKDVAEAISAPDAPETSEPSHEPPPPVGKLDALDGWAKARLEKLGSTQLRGGIPVDPIKDPQRLALYAIRGAAHIAKGVVKFADWAKEMTATFPDLAKDHLPRIWQAASRLHKMDENGRAAWVQKQFAVPGTGEGVQTTVRRLTGQSKPADVRRDLSNLAVKLKAEASGAKEGFKLGVASERNRNLTAEQSAETTVPLAAAMKARMVAEGKAYTAGAKEGHQAAVEHLEGVKRELVSIIEQNLPPEARGQFLPAVARARTLGDMSDAIARVERVVGEVDWREARGELRETVKNLDVDRLGPTLKEKAESFLSPVAMKDMSSTGEARLRSLVEFAEKDPEGVIPAEMVSAAKTALDKKRPEDMTAEEMRSLATVLKNIQAQDRLSKKLRLAGKYRETRDAVDEAMKTLRDKAKVESSGPLRKMFYELPTDDKGNLLADPRKKGWAALAERRLNPDTMALMLDGGREDGLFGHLLRAQPREGLERGMKLFYEGVDHLKNAVEKTGMKWGTRQFADWANERVPFTLEHKTGHLVRDESTGVTYGRKEGIGTSDLTLTRGQRIHLGAMLGDPETGPILGTIRLRDRRQAMGYELSESDKTRFLDSLSKEERSTIAAMKEWLGGKFMDEQNKQFVRIDGFERLKNRQYFKRIADRSDVAGQPPQSVQSFSRRYLEGLGQYKERLDHRHPLLVDDAFELYRDTIQKGSAFVGQAENLHSAWSVLGNGDVRRELANTYGTQILSHIDEFLGAATMVERPVRDEFDRFVSTWSSRAARAMLYRPTTALKQLTGSVTLMADLGVGPVTKAMAQVAAKPSLLVSVPKELANLSATIRDRYEGTFGRTITPQYKDRRSAVGITPLVDKVALGPMQKMDEVNATLAYLAARHTGMEPDAAAARAALAISRTQNSSNPLDYSGAQLMGRNNTAWRLATLFGSQNEAIYNLLARKTITYANGPKDAKSTAAYARDLALVGASTMVLGKLIDDSYKWATSDEDDRGRTERQKEQLEVRRARYETYRTMQDLGNVAVGPIASGGVVDAVRKFNGDETGGGLPWFRAAEDVGTGAKNIEDGWTGGDGRIRRGEQTDREKLFDGARRISKAIGVFGGIPYMGEGVSAVEKGVGLVSEDPQRRR